MLIRIRMRHLLLVAGVVARRLSRVVSSSSSSSVLTRRCVVASSSILSRRCTVRRPVLPGRRTGRWAWRRPRVGTVTNRGRSSVPAATSSVLTGRRSIAVRCS